MQRRLRLENVLKQCACDLGIDYRSRRKIFVEFCFTFNNDQRTDFALGKVDHRICHFFNNDVRVFNFTSGKVEFESSDMCKRTAQLRLKKHNHNNNTGNKQRV